MDSLYVIYVKCSSLIVLKITNKTQTLLWFIDINEVIIKYFNKMKKNIYFNESTFIKELVNVIGMKYYLKIEE